MKIKYLGKNLKKRTTKKSPRIQILDDSLLIDNSILILGDLHIGYEEHIAEEGVFPRIQLKQIIDKLKNIFWNLSIRGINVNKVIILGDLKHEFGGISDVEWRETLKLLDYLSEKMTRNAKKTRIILVKGNHDNILGPIAKKRNIKFVNYYNHKGICFMHGNKLYKNCFEKNKILILGHLHPAITISDKYKKEKYKCFLKGKWKGRLTYIIPSFSPISFGYNLNDIDKLHRDNEGFLIIEDKLLKNFEVFIFNNKENKEYSFGKLKKLIEK